MITKTYKTWETMSPFTQVNINTSYKIYDNITDATNQTNPIYNGEVLAGYTFSHLETILSQYIKPMNNGDITTYFKRDTGCIKTFYIYSSIDNWVTNTEEAEITLEYDWSYDTNDGKMLTNTEDRIVDNRQILPITTYYSGGTLTMVMVKSGGLVMYSWVASGNAYTTCFANLQTEYLHENDKFYITCTNDQTLNREYIVKNTCKDYCLYYLNERGGWDYFLINGKELQKDNVTNYTYKQLYNRDKTNLTGNFNTPGLTTYLKQYTETWELNTGWIDEAKSQKVISLLLSNSIYLHNLTTGEIKPVNVSSKSVEHKTYSNQNNKFIQYVINVENSQEKYRM